MNREKYEILLSAFKKARSALVEGLFEEAIDCFQREGLDFEEASSLASDLGCQLADPRCPLLESITTATDGLAYFAAVVHRQQSNQMREEIRHREKYSRADVELLDTQLARKDGGAAPLSDSTKAILQALASRLQSVSPSAAVFLLFKALLRPEASIREVARELGYGESERRKVARELKEHSAD